MKSNSPEEFTAIPKDDYANDDDIDDDNDDDDNERGRDDEEQQRREEEEEKTKTSYRRVPEKYREQSESDVENE